MSMFTNTQSLKDSRDVMTVSWQGEGPDWLVSAVTSLPAGTANGVPGPDSIVNLVMKEKVDLKSHSQTPYIPSCFYIVM